MLISEGLCNYRGVWLMATTSHATAVARHGNLGICLVADSKEAATLFPSRNFVTDCGVQKLRHRHNSSHFRCSYLWLATKQPLYLLEPCYFLFVSWEWWCTSCRIFDQVVCLHFIGSLLYCSTQTTAYNGGNFPSILPLSEWMWT